MKRNLAKVEDDAGDSKPKKAKATTAPKIWSEDEEARFLAAIDEIVKAHLWNKVKGDDGLAKRGANGIRSHWDALYKKLKK